MSVERSALNVERSGSAGGPVFLSYAREDTDAARRIADALRAFGVEVWFDQAELRGGDAWDGKIRRQIQDCALFLPVISAHTQGRREGYFRLEWKLAVERTHLMMEGVPFLVPVSVDDTAENRAAVPAEFLRVQWTRLPGALPSPQFIEHIKRLLDATTDATPTPRTGSRSQRATAAPATAIHLWRWLTVGLVLVVAGLVAFIAFRPATTNTSLPRAADAAAPARAKVSPKSIAVLPFANMSEDKDANAFFSDGIHEDILTNLALIRELTVVSRTSVMEYRATTKKMRQIGEELGVAYLLEGSVRRAGNTVRVTGQLIDARTDEHVWADNFDRDLTASGIFAIQMEIAKAIAAALHTRLSPQEKGLLERRPTENLAAYELYLKAGQTAEGRSAESRVPLLEECVRLDPQFAVAWAHLSAAHGSLYVNHRDRSPAQLEKAKAAIDTAVRLAPDHPDVMHLLGRYYYSAFNDYPRALEQYERVVRVQPNNAEVWHSIAAAHRRQGRWPEAVADFRKAVALDPASTYHRGNLEVTLAGGRYYEQAKAEARELAARRPDSLRAAFRVAELSFEATGASREIETFIANLTPTEAASPDGLEVRKRWARIRGDLAQFLELERLSPSDTTDEKLNAALALVALGDVAPARERLPNTAELRRQREREPLNPVIWSRLALVEVILGDKSEAVKCAERAIELYPESLDAYDGLRYCRRLALVYAWTGDKDRALAEYARLLRTPSGFQNVHVMKRAPEYKPLRGDPRFEALLNDPKNNAPLF